MTTPTPSPLVDACPGRRPAMDTPQVTPRLHTVDFTDADALFGPAEEGGFRAPGPAAPDAAAAPHSPFASRRAELTTVAGR